ncbi:MAG TPA: V4R domain-containing protein [Symbiobacteriaceae bacterium]|nr:V4R domain-containing protein [Symbiobacteriaceae bacterium]
MTDARTLGANVAIEAFQLFRLLGFESLAQALGADGEEREQIEYLAGMAMGRALIRQGRLAGTTTEQVLDSFVTFYDAMALGLVYYSTAGDGSWTVGIRECAGCDGIELAHKPVCFVEAGMIAGLLSEATGLEYTAREHRCIGGLGDHACEFVLLVQK